MTFKPLNHEDVFDGQTESTHEYFIELNAVRSAVEGLKDVRYYVAEDGQLCHSCNKERFTFAVSDMNWKPNSQVCAWCWINKWFPVFSQSHLNDSTYSSEDLRPSGSSMTEPANLDAVAIDLPCNPSQRVETVTSHSHSLFPDQEVRDLNNPLEKGGGSEQTSTLTPISARDFSTLAKQMGFSFYVDGNGKLLISHSQPSVHSEEVESRTQAERSEQHGVPAGEFKTESTSANGKDNTPKHAPGNGDCICKHGSGAITKTFVEQNGLCSCECHKVKE